MGEKQQHREPTQHTKPARGEPVEIPVPARDDFERLIEHAANTPDDGQDEEQPAAI